MNIIKSPETHMSMVNWFFTKGRVSGKWLLMDMGLLVGMMILVMVTQLWYTKSPWLVYLKWVNFMVCAFNLSKALWIRKYYNFMPINLIMYMKWNIPLYILYFPVNLGFFIFVAIINRVFIVSFNKYVIIFIYDYYGFLLILYPATFQNYLNAYDGC